jgi:long-chain acyl-CoA synthetase
MTRTRKVRRRHISEKYAAFVDAFYTGRDEVEVATSVTYEDGRQGTVQSRVRVEDVEEVAAGV